jgi:autotransporter-associated beta strand protein
MIANDDTTTVSIAPLSAVHPRADSGQVQYTFTVGLSNPSDFTTTVRVDTADRTALASQADYVPITAQTVTVAPSETSQVVAVEVPGKTLLENDKTFAVRLSEVAGSGALPGVSEAIGTILNSHGAIPIGPGGASLLIVSDTADPTGTTANVFFDVDGVQTLVYSVATSGFNQFQVVGGTGRDQVTLDFSHGSPLPSDGLIFEEAAGKTGDSLACIGLTGHVRMSSAGIEVGAAPPAVLRNVSFCGFSFADSSDNRLAIDGVTLAINRDHAISANADVEIVNGGVLDLGGKTDIVKSVTLTDGTIAHGTLQSDLHTLGSGAISAGLTQGSVVKSKPGTAVLSGNNGYAGGTTVLSGVLLAASVAALPQGGAVTIGAGATVVLAPNLNLGTSEAMTTRTVLALPAAESTVTGALPSFCQGLATVPLTTTERHLEARQGVPLRLSAKAGAPRLTSTSAPALAPTRLTPPSKTVGTGASHPVASARAHDLALAARDAERWRDDLAWLAELLQPRGQRRMAHALASPLPVSARL